MRALSLPILIVSLTGVVPRVLAQATDDQWWAYGRDAFGSRYSPLTQITPENVSRLTVAWTYRTGEMAGSDGQRREVKFEATPLVVDGTLYLATPRGKVIALDPETGRERWVYDAKVALNE